MTESTAPPQYSRLWMAPFLVEYVESGHLDRSAQKFLVFRRTVFFQVRTCPRFAAAFAFAREIVAESIWEACKHRVPGAEITRVEGGENGRFDGQ